MGVGAGGAAAIAGGVGAAGSIGSALISGGKGSGGSTTSSNAPWGPQQGYLENGFANAQNNYNSAQSQGPYPGQFYAPNSGAQNAAAGQAENWANGTGANIPGNTASLANTLESAAPGELSNLQNLAANGAGGGALSSILNGYANGSTPASSINPTLSSALNNAAVGSANTLSNFSNGQQQIMNQALSNPTQMLANDASTYMNSSPVQSAINSTNAQINQQLNESTVPQLNRDAAAGGQLNSSRAGMAESMANENAAIATGNADSSILNNAYNSGLSTAANTYNSNLSTGMYAANSGLVDNSGVAQGEQGTQLGQSEFGTTSALNAAGTGLNFDLGNANTQLGANSQLGNNVNMGINGATAAGNQAAQNYALYSTAGGLDQSGQQALDNNAYAQFMEPTNYNQGILQNYMQDINGSYGSSSSTEATLPPNLFGTALGGAATGVGLYNMFSTGTSPNAGAFNMGSGNYVTTGLGDGTSYVDNGFF